MCDLCMIKSIDYGGCWTTPISKHLSQHLQGLGAPTSLGNYLRKKYCFFDQRLGTNAFTNRGPRIFPTSDLGGLIEDVRQNKLLDSVTIPRQCNSQENINTWGTHQGKSQGGNIQVTGVFPGNNQRTTSLETYLTQARKRFCFTREGMGNTKSITLTSSACQIYGKVPAKIFHILFRRGIGRRK